MTVDYAKERISQFFPNDWPHVPVQSISVERIGEGFSNMVHLVKKPSGAGCKCGQACGEPDAVILRHYGGNSIDASSVEVKLTEVEEVMVAAEMSLHGLGPEMYGVFPGGRMEEYVDGRTLVPSDLQDKEISAEIAKNLARLHSLKPPLARNKYDSFLHTPSRMSQDDQKHLVADFMIKHPSLVPKLRQLLDWDLVSEKQWLSRVLKENAMRKSFTILDTNCLNILMRTDRLLVKTGIKKSFIVLIDYEAANYGFSGVDLGGQLMMRIIDLKHQKDMLSGIEYPDDDFIRDFVTAYVDECKILGTWDETTESLESVIRQTAIGTLFFALFFHEAIIMTTQIISAEPLFVNWIHRFMLIYHDIKRRVFHE